jgi:hypothetical protein
MNPDGGYTDLEEGLRIECERGFEVGPRGHSSVSATGEPFVVLTGSELLPDDEECHAVASATFREYAAGKSGTLYWRIYPEIERGQFYMRLLISDKPASCNS